MTFALAFAVILLGLAIVLAAPKEPPWPGEMTYSDSDIDE